MSSRAVFISYTEQSLFNSDCVTAACTPLTDGSRLPPDNHRQQKSISSLAVLLSSHTKDVGYFVCI